MEWQSSGYLMISGVYSRAEGNSLVCLLWAKGKQIFRESISLWSGQKGLDLLGQSLPWFWGQPGTGLWEKLMSHADLKLLLKLWLQGAQRESSRVFGGRFLKQLFSCSVKNGSAITKTQLKKKPSLVISSKNLIIFYTFFKCSGRMVSNGWHCNRCCRSPLPSPLDHLIHDCLTSESRPTPALLLLQVFSCHWRLFFYSHGSLAEPGN